jgi:hypothetical protein
MTPKEKAIQLVNIYLQVYDGKVKEAIQCALNSVNEILLVLSDIDYNDNDTTIYNTCLFYNQTKTELKKML